MKLFVVSLLAAVALAAPQQQQRNRQQFQQQQQQQQQQYEPEPQQQQQQQQYRENTTPIPILRLVNDHSIDGSYKTSYETGNKIQLDEQGYLKNLGNKEQEAQVSEGQVSYINPDGQQISLSYTADENGYRPTGDHLPTPPPIPEEILKALELIRNTPPRTRPAGQTEDDGQYYPEPDEIAAREQYFRNQ